MFFITLDSGRCPSFIFHALRCMSPHDLFFLFIVVLWLTYFEDCWFGWMIIRVPIVGMYVSNNLTATVPLFCFKKKKELSWLIRILCEVYIQKRKSLWPYQIVPLLLALKDEKVISFRSLRPYQIILLIN